MDNTDSNRITTPTDDNIDIAFVSYFRKHIAPSHNLSLCDFQYTCIVSSVTPFVLDVRFIKPKLHVFVDLKSVFDKESKIFIYDYDIIDDKLFNCIGENEMSSGLYSFVIRIWQDDILLTLVIQLKRNDYHMINI